MRRRPLKACFNATCGSASIGGRPGCMGENDAVEPDLKIDKMSYAASLRSSRGMSARGHTITLRSGTPGIASTIGFGSMRRRLVGGSGILSGLLTKNFTQAMKSQNAAPQEPFQHSHSRRCSGTCGMRRRARGRSSIRSPTRASGWRSGSSIGPVVPGLEGVLDVGQASVGEFGVVTQDHGLEVGPVDPAPGLPRCRRPRCSQSV